MSPELTGALFQALQPHGYRHLVIETSPPLSRELEPWPRTGGVEAVLELSRPHPFAVPFFSWTEEAELLARVVERANTGPVFWGVDYEFMATPTFWFRWLEDRAESPEGAARARELAGAEARALDPSLPGDAQFPTRRWNSGSSWRGWNPSSPGRVIRRRGSRSMASAKEARAS